MVCLLFNDLTLNVYVFIFCYFYFRICCLSLEKVKITLVNQSQNLLEELQNRSRGLVPDIVFRTLLYLD